MPRGYFGIALIQPKKEHNVGGLLRSADIFGASFVSIVGHRYKRQASDTTHCGKQIPFFHYDTVDEFIHNWPVNCVPVVAELCNHATSLPKFYHPERAMYILGPEDGSVPQRVIDKCKYKVVIPGKHCLNLATAGSILLYDRVSKSGQF